MITIVLIIPALIIIAHWQWSVVSNGGSVGIAGISAAARYKYKYKRYKYKYKYKRYKYKYKYNVECCEQWGLSGNRGDQCGRQAEHCIPSPNLQTRFNQIYQNLSPNLQTRFNRIYQIQ